MWSFVAGNPIFLWLLPAAALPVLFHLFLRTRRRSMAFPSLMFFLDAQPRLHARRKIREVLTLVARVLAILFLLLALARPLWQGGRGAGSAAKVILIDNSASMGGYDGDGNTKLHVALETASALIWEMRNGDSAALALTVDDPAAVLPDGLTSDREALLSALNRIRETHAGGSPMRAMDRACAVLAGAASARREILILSDLQKNEWGGAAHSAIDTPAGTWITVVRVPSQPRAGFNVAIAGIELPRQRMVAGRRHQATVTLRNTSGSDGRIRVMTESQDGAKSYQAVEIPARAVRLCSVPTEARSAGTGWVRVELEGDGFAGDNHACVVFSCHEKQKVLFVGGAVEFGVLPLAVSPSGDGAMSGLVPSILPSGASIQDSLRNPPALVVISADRLSQAGVAGLRDYLERGGTVLLTPGAGKAPPSDAIPDWMPKVGNAVVSQHGRPAVMLNRQSQIWDDLRTEAGAVALRNVRVFRWHALDGVQGSQAIMGLEDGTTLLTEQPVGRGNLFVSGINFDSGSSTLPLKAGFVALVHAMALVSQSAQENVRTIEAGAAPSTILQAGEASLSVRSIAGDALEWHGQARNVPALPRCGVYAVQGERDLAYVAVRSRSDEGEEEFVGGASVPALSDVRHSVVEYTGKDRTMAALRRMRDGVELFPLFAILALAALLAEGLVANVGKLPTNPRPNTSSGWFGKVVGVLRSMTGTDGDRADVRRGAQEGNRGAT